jgi:multiple sugar transport system permease protein
MKLRNTALAPYLFLSPFLLLFAVFGIFPLVFSLYLAFQTWDPIQGIDAMSYVGLGNFRFTLGDDWFWKSLYNTLWLALVAGIPQHLVAIPLACFLQQHFKRMRNTLVGMYFLPYITSTVAIAIMFSALLSTDYGAINLLLRTLAEVPLLSQFMPNQNIDWLNRPENIKPAVALVVFWRYVGFNTVLYLAALQSIPKELYEAATMDGASPRQQFWKITLPQLKPMMLFGVTLSVIGGLQLFEEPFILTNGTGGSDIAGMTTAMYMFKTAFEFNDFGIASAISWMLFAVIVVLTLITRFAFREHQSPPRSEQEA